MLVPYASGSSANARPTPPAKPWPRQIGFWVPQRFVGEAGIDTPGFLADLNRKIAARGMVLGDGQLLRRPLEQSLRWDEHWEAGRLQTPPRRKWGEAQQRYFGLADPYQMADEGDGFTWSNIFTGIDDPYLAADETILGVVHGREDRAYFQCVCHQAAVVYTSRRRLVCMWCGAVHLVLRDPLDLPAGQVLGAREWQEYFDPDGRRRHEPVDLPLVEFRWLEAAETVWQTDQWDESRRLFVLLARTPPAELAELVRGTELDSSILEEAGWERVIEPPPPASAVAGSTLAVDLVEGAAQAVAAGTCDFLAGALMPRRLPLAVMDLARAVELLLKARLQEADEDALRDRPNNPTVLRRLAEHDVAITAAELETLGALRRLRNTLQHDSAQFNHRDALGLCRDSLIFLAEFAHRELGLWLAWAVDPADWQALLEIEPLAEKADLMAHAELQAARGLAEADVSECEHCGRETMLRARPESGARCVRCRYVPVAAD